MVDLFRYPTVSALADLFRPDEGRGGHEARKGRERAERRRQSAARTSTDVAVIGLTCRYPGARDAQQFWHNLLGGVESIHFFSDEELLERGLPRALIDNPAYVPAAGILEDPDHFDAQLFGISPREAALVDPQQRLFLECAWEALENAGHLSEEGDRAVGVFAGVGLNFYLAHLLADPDFFIKYGFLPITLANSSDYLATRLSYKLNLKGPSLSVQTACSTSLVATHMACQSLLNGECDMALAGGTALGDDTIPGHFYEDGGISSSDGHTRTFDARGVGATGGAGVGVVVLKRLQDAMDDGDSIHAVIKGSAVNNDGSNKVGFTAPGVEGQTKVIAEALSVAGIDPATVSMIEAHGTATSLGDPIEVTALREVYGAGPEKRIALGSVKTNIGHTDTAAGVAGLIKTVLALRHRQIPPSLHFEEPNPELGLDASPFYVPTEARDWIAVDGGPRRAGVSSFGLGGTNVHVILEEPPPAEPTGPSRPWQLLMLSAATDTALEAATERLVRHLEDHPETSLPDAAFTLHVGRRRLDYRRILVCRDVEDAASALGRRDPERILSAMEKRSRRPVAFLFPGLGDHALRMGQELYETEPVFRQELDRCAELLKPYLDEPGIDGDLMRLLYPDDEPAETAETDTPGKADMRRLFGRQQGPHQGPQSPAAQRLNRTRFAQPAVFAMEIALARLWMSWGLRPESMIGYSLGEYTAACLAGVLDLKDAVNLVAERARLIDSLPAGAMLAVGLPEKEATALLEELPDAELSLAAVNGPRLPGAADG